MLSQMKSQWYHVTDRQVSNMAADQRRLACQTGRETGQKKERRCLFSQPSEEKLHTQWEQEKY